MTLTLAELLAEARGGLARLTAHELSDMLRHDADASAAASRQAPHTGQRSVVVLDTRTPTDRSLYGCIPGSIHTPRTVLEWRVAPDAPLRLAEIQGTDQVIVVVCNEGFSSSIAAATLQRLGFANATDLDGGVMAWRAAGLAMVDSDGDEVGIKDEA